MYMSKKQIYVVTIWWNCYDIMDWWVQECRSLLVLTALSQRTRKYRDRRCAWRKAAWPCPRCTWGCRVGRRSCCSTRASFPPASTSERSVSHITYLSFIFSLFLSMSHLPSPFLFLSLHPLSFSLFLFLWHKENLTLMSFDIRYVYEPIKGCVLIFFIKRHHGQIPFVIQNHSSTSLCKQ